MEQRKINPWKWQDQYGFSQGIEVTNASRVLYCAGQASVDDTGKPVHAGDMRKQIEAQTPLGRIGQPQDIATAAVFFASGDSAWLTGETLTVAGGYP